MDYAVVEISGKQYKAQSGKTLKVDLLANDVGDDIIISNVLLIASQGNIMVGSPLITGATITATIVKHTKAKKIRVLRFKAKSHYHKVTGHRQRYTELLVKPFGETKKPSKKEADKSNLEV